MGTTGACNPDIEGSKFSAIVSGTHLGNYSFRITVTDSAGATAYCEVVFEVN